MLESSAAWLCVTLCFVIAPSHHLVRTACAHDDVEGNRLTPCKLAFSPSIMFLAFFPLANGKECVECAYLIYYAPFEKLYRNADNPCWLHLMHLCCRCCFHFFSTSCSPPCLLYLLSFCVFFFFSCWSGVLEIVNVMG